MDNGFNMESALAAIDADFPLEGGADDSNTLDDPTLVTETTSAPPALEAPKPPVVTEGDPADPSAAPSEAQSLVAPKTWRKEAMEKWDSLDPMVKAEVLKREEDMFKGIEGYKADAEYGRGFKAVVSPYEPLLRQHGIDPVQQVNNLMQSHYTLAFGTPEQKQQLIQQVCRDYGIELGDPGEPAYIDPAVKSLQDEIQELKSFREQTVRAQQQQATSRAEQEIAKFSADPKNVHFEAVQGEMTKLIKDGQAKTLQEAYDQAIWLNPVVRQQELERQTAQRAEAAKKEEQARVDAAKAASAANVRTRARSGSGTATTGTMDDTIKEALANIKSRS